MTDHAACSAWQLSSRAEYQRYAYVKLGTNTVVGNTYYEGRSLRGRSGSWLVSIMSRLGVSFLSRWVVLGGLFWLLVPTKELTVTLITVNQETKASNILQCMHHQAINQHHNGIVGAKLVPTSTSTSASKFHHHRQ